ncbi:MAG: hypothetical protein AB8H86_04815 [Polyangiales bacterium]
MARDYFLRLGALIAVLSMGCGDDLTPDGGVDGGRDVSIDVPVDTFDVGPLMFALRAPEGANIGETIAIEVVGGEPPYEWQVGSELVRTEEATIERSFSVQGRYPIRVTLADGRQDSALVVVTAPPVFESSHSSTVSVGPEHVAVVVPDTGELVLTRFVDGGFRELTRVRPCADPVSVTLWMAGDVERFVVACDRDARLALVQGAEVEVLSFAPGSRPRGVAIDGGRAFVTLQGLGALAEVTEEGGLSVAVIHPAVRDVRAIAALPGGGVVAARFRSRDEEGELFWMNGPPRTVPLRFDPQPSADTESGGVPTLLGGLVASPDASHLVVVGQQANIGEGAFVSERPLTFETSIRAGLRVVSAEGEEVWEERFLFDNRGLATAAVFSPRGDTLYVLDQAHRSIERLDRLNGEILGSLFDVGYGASGLGISRDGRTLFVNAETSRELRAYSVAAMGPSPPQARVTLVLEEPLAEEVLRGRVLFEDSFDPRLARDGYIACASCHPGGDSDHRVWDFSDRGEGLRRTPPLFGRTLDGPLHWSANFDEVQDFENDIRHHFGGLGLMDPADFAANEDTLGAPKAGLSEDLDALAAYVASLAEDLPSPQAETVAEGAAVFERQNCRDCHSGERYTDSALVDGVPRLHDVGTLGPGSGQRLGEPLLGVDTPTLIGLWHSPRYLHDGSAATLREVLTTRDPEGRHGNVAGLPPAELDALLAFLESL